MDLEESSNLENLKSIHTPEFMDELEDIPETIKPKQVSQFYTIVLNHFENEIPEEIGRAILGTIAKIICIDEYLNIFIQTKSHLRLPYKKKQFVSDIYDILFVIVTAAPIAYEENLSRAFGGIIRRDPSKALTLLAMYSQHFNEIDNPWPMVDLLIQEAHRFQGIETATNFATLLAFLCRKYPDYCEGRSEHCWRKISALLALKDIPTLKSVYCALFSITEVYKEAVSPLELMKPHLKIRDLQDSVLTLLLAAPPVGKDTRDKVLLQTLCQMGERNKNATLVLMRIATDNSFAEFLIQNAGLWMTKELPSVIDTMRLFFVVFAHVELRNSISESPKFIEFLKMVTEGGSGSTLSMICTIIRRIEISEDFIAALSETGFLGAFFTTAVHISNITAMHAAFLMLDTLAKIGYAREYLKMCEIVAKTVQDRGELAEVATLVAIQLCEYKRCVQVFKKVRLDEFMKRNLSNSKLKANAAKFLDAIADD